MNYFLHMNRKKADLKGDLTEEETGKENKLMKKQWHVIEEVTRCKCFKWCVLSSLSTEQHRREEMEKEKFWARQKSVMKWWRTERNRGKFPSSCKNVNSTVVLCTVCVVCPHPVFVVVYRCSTFFSVHFVLCFIVLFFPTASVCSTSGPNCLSKLHFQLFPSHTGAGWLIAECHVRKHKLQENQINDHWCDAAKTVCEVWTGIVGNTNRGSLLFVFYLFILKKFF